MMLNSLGGNFLFLPYRGNKNGIRNERLHTSEQQDYTAIQLSLLEKCVVNVNSGIELHR